MDTSWFGHLRGSSKLRSFHHRKGDCRRWSCWTFPGSTLYCRLHSSFAEKAVVSRDRRERFWARYLFRANFGRSLHKRSDVEMVFLDVGLSCERVPTTVLM